jgi:hypothetical protein
MFLNYAMLAVIIVPSYLEFRSSSHLQCRSSINCSRIRTTAAHLLGHVILCPGLFRLGQSAVAVAEGDHSSWQSLSNEIDLSRGEASTANDLKPKGVS